MEILTPSAFVEKSTQFIDESSNHGFNTDYKRNNAYDKNEYIIRNKEVDLKIGDVIEHQQFGRGKIVVISREITGDTIVINFEEHGTKVIEKQELVQSITKDDSQKGLSHNRENQNHLLTTQQSQIPDNNTDCNLKVGDVIEHQRFGIGTVTKVFGEGKNTKILVQFKERGIKQFLVMYMKYKLIS